MSCRFCGTAERTVRVVAYDPIVTYACGTEFFPTEQELGEPLDKCWSQSQECKAKAPVKEDGKRAARLDTYPVAHVEALEARLAALEAENKALRDRFAEADTERKGAQIAIRGAYDAASRAADMRAAGNALARHVAEDTRGQTARKLVEAWEEASR